ncbi:hypothetical protein RhiirA1_466947 [Rhizophagus irregularis]|uniref:MULE transposase domain-containing protein n=1 Tax=Rhizophagus irregularis TaxID=588596 RepID=A0A2N0RCY3_9GLOM|nr:hypothetical protein RhiirA1_466947 [Rhizophagus irregularis]
MEQLIPINFVDLTPNITPIFSENPDITDLIIVEQVNSAIGKGAYRSILKYIVPAYIQNEKLDPASPIIHFRISGDGHNVIRKVKHVMITVALLDDSANLFGPNYHYTVVLFPGTENYSTLKIAANALIQELQELSSIGMKICDTDDNWCYTSLIKNDKLCRCSSKFNLAKLFNPERAVLIRSLWNGFAELYDLLEKKETNPHYFCLKAKEWYELFLKKTVVNPETNIILVQGLYRSSDLISYIHVLVSHIWEFMFKHQKWGLNSFLCSAVKKKNHNHISYFFRKTLKNCGKFQNKTSAIREIMEHENWLFFYTQNNIPLSYSKPQYIHIL